MKSLLFFAALLLGLAARSPAEVVVSIRYFKTEGVSHYHLFLYRDDGNLIRQLTAPKNAHDVGPKFSQDGKSIYFTRRLVAHKGRPTKVDQIWKIQSNGQGARLLKTVPAGFPVREYPVSASSSNQRLDPDWALRDGRLHLPIPGGKLEFVRTPDPGEVVEGVIDRSQSAFLIVNLRELDSGAETPFVIGEEPFMGDLVPLNGSPVFEREGLSVAFYYFLTGSSGGARIGAIDLRKKRLVSITELNPAVIVPHGTRSGFFSIASERYQDLPAAEPLSVNCLYLDWWNQDFQRVRFADRLSLFGGASIRHPRQPQLDIPYDAEWSRGM